LKNLKSNLLIYPLLLVILSIWLISDTSAGSHLDWGGDYAGYLLQAQSISNGNVQELSDSLKKIVQLTDGENYTFAQTPAPWGYPIFISTFEFFHQWDIVKLKYLNLFLNLFFLLIFYKSLRLFMDNYESLLFTTLISMLPIFMEFHYKILTEMLFSSLIILGFYLHLKSNFQDKSFHRYEAIIFGLSFLVRKQAIFWLVAYLLVSIINSKKTKKDDFVYIAFFFIPFILFYFILRVNPIGNAGPSAGEWGGFINVNFERLVFIFKEIGFLVTRFPNDLSSLVGLVILLLMTYFCVKDLNTQNLFLVVYSIFHMFYSINDTQRFWMPLVGIILFQFLFYFHNIMKKYFPNIVISLFVIVISIYWLNSAGVQKNYYFTSNGPNNESFRELSNFISTQSQDNLYVFHSPRVFYYFTNYRSYRLGETIYPNSIFVCEKDTTSICTDQRFTKVDISNALNIFENDKFILYKLSNG